MANIVKISATALKNNDISSWLLFPYIVDPIEFKATFAKIGIRIQNMGDLKYLKVAHKKGLDINGKIKNSNGNRIYFDILKLCKNVNLSKKELSTALKNKLIEFTL